MESSSAALNLHVSSICFQFQFQYPTRADFSDLVRTQGAREYVQHQRLQMSVPFYAFIDIPSLLYVTLQEVVCL